MTINPTFLARFLRDGSTALQCRETGTRYVIADLSGGFTANGGRPVRDDCGAYREGQLIRTGPRAAMVNAIESDARWTIRAAH